MSSFRMGAGGWPAWGLAICLILPALVIVGYSPEQDNVGGPVATHWPNGQVTWDLNPTATNVTTTGGTDIPMTITNSFNSWQQAQVGGQSLLALTITRGPDTSNSGVNDADCVNTISFMDANATTDFPSGTIAFTDLATVSPSGTYSCTTPPTTRNCPLASCIVDADIVFNPAEKFSTTTPPITNDFDLQSTATHEIGHLLGLDHSGIAHAIMYPFGDTSATGEQRALSVDDAVGVSFLYPNSSFASATGKISGTVMLGGVPPQGAFAAHIIAIDATTGNAVIDGLANIQGSYTLVGVPPGTYNVLVLPLAGVYDITNFGGWECGYARDPANCTGFPANPTNYTGKFH